MFNSSQTLIFYIFIFAFSIFTLFLSEKTKHKETKNVLTFLSFFSLWFINVFRSSSVGGDYVNVGNNFSRIVTNSISSKKYNWFWLPLRIFCKIIGLFFGSNPFWFYFVLGTLFVVFLYKFLFNSCQNKTLSLILFIVFGLYLQSFNQTRQILALIIILYSSKFLKSNELKKYIFTVLFASIFHESSLIFLILYPLKNIKVNSKMIFLYFMGTLFLFLSNNFIYKIVSFTKYSIYFTSQYNLSNVRSSILNLFIRIIMMSFCILFKKELTKDKVYNFSLHMVIICTILQVLVTKYYFFGRITTYFFSFYVILLPKCLQLFCNKFSFEKRYLICVPIFIVLCMYFIVYYRSPSGSIGSGYDSYSFIFFDKRVKFHETRFKTFT